jgi:RNAse (barnase) inhibitor barstar
MEITIQGGDITDIASFYKEVNRVFMQDESWKIGQSLDAFHDLLYGGFGLMHGHAAIRIMWKDIEKSKQALGFEPTKHYYLKKLEQDSPFNKNYFSKKLKELEEGNGPTYFDIIIEILSEHEKIILIQH